MKATAGWLAVRLDRPLFLEGEAGVGKTSFATALAEATGLNLIRLQCYEGLDLAQALYDWDFPRQILHLRAVETAASANPQAGPVGSSQDLEAELFDERFLQARPVLRALQEAPCVLLVDELDLRDLRSVVNAAGDAGRDEEARALASQLREALANRVEKEHAAWLAELAETVQAGRVVRALRLSSRPPKAGAPIPGDVATQLAEATAASLTDETGPDRWATVLDALAYSPVRRRVIPQSLPTKLSPDLRTTIARLASRLPEIAHIFDIEPDPAAERAARDQARRRSGGRKGGAGDRKGGGGQARGDRKGKGGGDRKGGERGDRKAGGGQARGARKGGGDTPTVGGKDDNAEVPATTGAETSPTDAAKAAATGAESAPTTTVAATDATSTEAGDTPQTTDATSAEAATDAPAAPVAASADESTAAPEADSVDESPAAGAPAETGTPPATADTPAEADAAVANGAGDGTTTPTNGSSEAASQPNDAADAS